MFLMSRSPRSRGAHRAPIAPRTMTQHAARVGTVFSLAAVTAVGALGVLSAPSAEAASLPVSAPLLAASVQSSLPTENRDEKGRGSYVCSEGKLYFEACDPGNLGERVDYPLYSGSSAKAAPAKESTSVSRSSSAPKASTSKTSAPKASKPAAKASGSRSGVNWDAVAQCESGGKWSTNTGNGYSGGLQFSPSTWRAFGGTGSPQNASRERQIEVAENVLDGQGIGAWPVCGKKG